MSKDPAFLFYPNDWLGGTMGMTFEEKGAYMDLLMLQFNSGHMTIHMIGQVVGQLWENVKRKFVVDDNGLYYNERLEKEITKRQKYCDSRRNNELGVNQYTNRERSYDQPYDHAVTTHMTGHTAGHMGNENININTGLIKERKRGSGGKRKSVIEAPLFATFYDAYPKKAYRAEASAIFTAMNVDDNMLADIMFGLEKWKSCYDWTKENGRYVPQATRWLKNREWENEPPQVTASSNGNGRARQLDVKEILSL